MKGSSTRFCNKGFLEKLVTPFEAMQIVLKRSCVFSTAEMAMITLTHKLYYLLRFATFEMSVYVQEQILIAPPNYE